MRNRTCLSLLVVCTVLLMAASCASKPEQYYDTGVSDAEYVDIAREHPHARAFLERYPLAETYVDRSGRLAVDFRVDRRPVTESTQSWEGIRLRVFLSPQTMQPTETLLQCDERILTHDVLGYLEEYFTTQACP